MLSNFPYLFLYAALSPHLYILTNSSLLTASLFCSVFRFPHSGLPHSKFGPLVSINSSRICVRVCVKRTAVCVFMVIKKHDTWCKSVAHSCVFNSRWITMELCGREGNYTSAFDRQCFYSRFLIF